MDDDFTYDPPFRQGHAISVPIWKMFGRVIVHTNMLICTAPSKLRLSPLDDKVYKRFRELFPFLRVDVLSEADIDNPDLDETWCQFHNEFREYMKNHTEPTIVRIKHAGSYDEDNTIVVSKLMFHAVELSRNREGYRRYFAFRY